MRFFADGVLTNSGQTARIELIQVGSSATFQRLKGNAERGFFSFSHQKINIEDPFSDPIQKGALQVHVWIQSQAQLDFVKAVLSGQEGDFIARYYLDDVPVWTGNILPDLSEYDEMSFDRQSATLFAKDTSLLAGIDFSALNTRRTWIDTIARILGLLGFEKNIITATSWSQADIDEANDYLRQIYHSVYGLQQFGRAGEENEPISALEALESILRNNGLILKQWEGWRLDQFTAYNDPSAVEVATYAPDGTLISQSTEDRRLILNRNDQRIVIGSTNRGIGGLKRARVRFDHRTTVSNLQFPPWIRLTDNDPTYPDSQVISSTGDTRIELSASSVHANFDSPVTSGNMQVVIQAMGMYWHEDSGEWLSGFIANSVELFDYGTDQLVGSFAFSTGPLPIGSGQLQITLYNATSGPEQAAETLIQGIHFDITDPSVPEGSSTAIDYLLSQQGSYSLSYDHGAIWYGDGPVGYARSALTVDPDGSDLTMSNWGRRGESKDQPFTMLLLREIMDFQRGWRKNLSAHLVGTFDPSRILSYEGEHYYSLGGDQDGLTGDWTPELIQIDIETSQSDTFQQLLKYTADSSTGSAPPGGGGGSGTASWNRITGKPSGQAAWATETGFDDRYFRQSQNLSEGDPVAMRGNLGLGDLAVLDRVDTDQIVDGAVTNAKLEHSTISGIALGDDLFSIIPGDGIAGNPYNGSAARTWSIDYTDPLRIEDGALGIYDHGEGQRGVLSPDEQDIFGVKRFQDDIILNDRMVTDDYVARLRGMLLTSEGLADLRSLFVDELVSKTFISDTTLSLASSTYTTKSMSTLAGSVELPTQGVDFLNFMTGAQAKFAETARAIELSGDYETNRFILPVEPHDTVGGLSNALVFEEGDYIRLRAIDRTGGMRMINLWGTVTYPVEGDPSSVERSDGVQEFVFDLLHPANIDVPIAINAGSVILDYGKPGDAVMERSALGDDGPFDRQFTWQGVPWDTSQYSVLTHIGNLESSPAGFSGAGAYLRDNVLIESANGDFRAGKNADGQGHFGIYLDEDNYWLLERGFSVKAVTDEMDDVWAGISALQDEIDLRVETDDVINSINISEEEIRISGNRLHVTSATTFDSDVTIKGVLDGVKGTFSGELSAASGSFGDVSVGVGGRISLPPSWSGDERTGYLDRRGLNLLWVSQEGGDHPGAGLSQEISWYTGLAGYSGRIRPSGTGSGILHISSDFGLTLDTAAGKHIAIRPGDFGSIRMTRIGRSNGRTGGYSAGAGLVIDPDVYIAVITEVTGSPWYTFTYSGTTPSQGDTKIVYNDTSNDISASGTTVANGFTRNFSLRAKEYVKLVRVGSSWSPPAT